MVILQETYWKLHGISISKYLSSKNILALNIKKSVTKKGEYEKKETISKSITNIFKKQGI